MVQEVRNSIAFYGILSSGAKIWLCGLGRSGWRRQLLQPVGGQCLAGRSGTISVCLPASLPPAWCHPDEQNSSVKYAYEGQVLVMTCLWQLMPVVTDWVSAVSTRLHWYMCEGGHWERYGDVGGTVLQGGYVSDWLNLLSLCEMRWLPLSVLISASGWATPSEVVLMER